MIGGAVEVSFVGIVITGRGTVCAKFYFSDLIFLNKLLKISLGLFQLYDVYFSNLGPIWLVSLNNVS